MEQQEKYDFINPPHYNRPGGNLMQFIDCFELGFSLGNVVKYVVRSGNKPGQSVLRDLLKAKWYLDHEIERLQKLESDTDNNIDVP